MKNTGGEGTLEEGGTRGNRKRKGRGRGKGSLRTDISKSRRLWGEQNANVVVWSICTPIRLCCYAAAKKSTANDVLFDDDDMLGSMGLESPQLASRKSTLLLPDSPPDTGARSVFDNLLQGGKPEKKTPQSDIMTSGTKTPGLLSTSYLFITFQSV